MHYYRPATERGAAEFDWLSARYTFSFADYYDPAHMGFSTLRVINEDRIAPGGGFPTHGHRDMEIITVVLEGSLSHQDSLGNGSTIIPGDIQVMSAGTGVRHSEFNAASTEPVHLLQIWIQPKRNGVAPSYGQRHFEQQDTPGHLQLLVSGDGRAHSLTINQDANLYGGVLEAEQSLTHLATAGRSYWIQLVGGALAVNGQRLATGDGLGLVDQPQITMVAQSRCEFLLFELAQ